MKRSFIAVLVGACILSQSISAFAAGELIQVKAKGLVCDYCARALEKVFKKRPEVQDLKVDLTTKDISIQLKEGQTMGDATIMKLVTDSGYNVDVIKREQS